MVPVSAHGGSGRLHAIRNTHAIVHECQHCHASPSALQNNPQPYWYLRKDQEGGRGLHSYSAPGYREAQEAELQASGQGAGCWLQVLKGKHGGRQRADPSAWSKGTQAAPIRPPSLAVAGQREREAGGADLPGGGRRL